MTIRKLTLTVAGVLALGVCAQAAEVRVLSSNAFKTVLDDLGPKFEAASGHKLVLVFGTAATLTSEIEKGAAVDVAVLTDSGINDLVELGRLSAATEVAESRAGVAIKRGATGLYLKSLFEQLGLADQVKAKTKLVKSAGEAVANGEAEIGFTQISEILPYAGAEVAGPLPEDIQLRTNFSTGIGQDSKDRAAAAAFVQFLATPASAGVIKGKGLDPR